MKIDDVQLGVEYQSMTYGRVRAEEVVTREEPGHAYSGGRYVRRKDRKSRKVREVRVTLLLEDTGEEVTTGYGRTFRVPARNLVRPWAEHAARDGARAASVAEGEATASELQERLRISLASAEPEREQEWSPREQRHVPGGPRLLEATASWSRYAQDEETGAQVADPASAYVEVRLSRAEAAMLIQLLEQQATHIHGVRFVGESGPEPIVIEPPAPAAERELTLDRVVELGACDEQIEEFCDLFGNRVMVTEELAEQHAQEFDFSWAAQFLLNPDSRRTWEAQDVDGVRGWNETLQPHRERWHADETYWKEYQQVRREAQLVLRKSRARSFARLYIQDGTKQAGVTR